MEDDVFLLYFLDLLGFIYLFLSLWHGMSRRISFDNLVFVEKVETVTEFYLPVFYLLGFDL